MSGRDHWEKVYRTRSATAVSWYQAEAALSLELIRRVAGDPEASILDVGGGASTLVDGLLDAGYQHLSVLDIAPTALAVAQQRLGDRWSRVEWITADVLTHPFPAGRYAVWHDRAVFHFLTDAKDRAAYVAQTRHAVSPGGHVIVASFAPEGPERCSGLEVMRYSPEAMHAEFGSGFRLLDSVREDHHTPAGATQAFLYCLCRVEATGLHSV